MSNSQTKYKALEAIADSIRLQSRKAEINPGNITVTLASHFWQESLSDVTLHERVSDANMTMLNVERERAFAVHGIKFVRGDK